MKWLKWGCTTVALAVFCAVTFVVLELMKFDREWAEDSKRFAYVREFAHTGGGERVLVTIGADGYSPQSNACDAQIEIFVNDAANKDGFDEPGSLSVCEFAGLVWSRDNSVVAIVRRKVGQPNFLWTAYDFRLHKWVYGLNAESWPQSPKIHALIKARGGIGRRFPYFRDNWSNSVQWIKYSRQLNWQQSEQLEKQLGTHRNNW